MDNWRLLPYHVGGSEEHFALSDALARTVSRPTLWWHSTDRATLILGAAQRRLVPSGDSVIRVVRTSGGTAVYATDEVLGMDIGLPAGHPFVLPDVVESYRWLGETWVAALEILGLQARIVSIEEVRGARSQAGPLQTLVNAACFGSLSPYEVVIDGRKLVGLAQLRRRSGILLQSGIHLRFDADQLAQLLSPEQSAPLAGELRRNAVGLQDALADSVDFHDVMDAFQTALRLMWDIELSPGAWTADEVATARKARN